jgi:hypothetical protein
MNYTELVAREILKIVADENFATKDGLNSVLRLLTKWRSKLVDNTLVAKCGTLIMSGPFRGMEFMAATSEANVAPRILGSYESELHPIIDEIIGTNYRALIDIGCADGYYACGFAYRMPDLRVFAYDTNVAAQKLCADLAKKNGLADRVTIDGEFSGSDFDKFVGMGALIFIDAEGIEETLLDPIQFPALKTLAMLVECHDVFKPSISATIQSRFEDTHSICRIEPSLHACQLPDFFRELSHMDQLLAIWEWRMGPTPWLYMVPRKDIEPVARAARGTVGSESRANR